MNEWDKIFKDRMTTTWEPNEDIVRFFARHVKKRIGVNEYEEKKKIERVLDLGCGNGRHLMFLAKQQFKVWGIDISQEAVDIFKIWSGNEYFKPCIKVGNITDLPYTDDFFDIIISDGVLDHMLMKDAKKAMKEAHRVMKKDGLICITLRADEDSDYGQGTPVGINTYKSDSGIEPGTIQHFFTMKEIEELIKDFETINLERTDRFYGNFTTKFSRWVVTAKKVE